MSLDCGNDFNLLLDNLLTKKGLKEFEITFLNYLKNSTNINGKIYVIQKFVKRLKTTPKELFGENFKKYNDCINKFDLKLCEERFQDFINDFLSLIKTEENLPDNTKKIIKYLKGKKYIQMELMEKLVIYVILDDLIKIGNIYKKSDGDDIFIIKEKFNELFERCKFRSHLGFI